MEVLESLVRPRLLAGYKVLLLENINEFAAQCFTELGCKVKCIAGSLGSEELKTKIKGFDIVGIRSKTRLTAEVIEASDKLKIICCFCIGTDQVDLAAALRAGIPVFHSPYANGLSVAELIIAEILCLSRNLMQTNQSVHSGKWIKAAVGNHEIKGKTLGILGYGNIGVKVADYASAMGMKTQYYDIMKKKHPQYVIECSTFEDLLKTSDFLTIHVPGGKQVANMIGEAQISIMKKGSHLLNASRGNVVDIKALASALKSKHLAGAAIDVFPKEPKENNETFHTELAGMPNVILTPHIGGSTEEAQKAVAVEVLTSVMNYFVYGSVFNSANFTTLELLPIPKGMVRVICCHTNTPGTLKVLNEKLAMFNVHQQTSIATDHIAYASIDVEFVESSDPDNLSNCVEEIDEIPECLWTRQLLP